MTEPTSGKEDMLVVGIGIVSAGGTPPLALPERALLGGLPRLAREVEPFPPKARGSSPEPSSNLELRGPAGIVIGDAKSLEGSMLQNFNFKFARGKLETSQQNGMMVCGKTNLKAQQTQH